MGGARPHCGVHGCDGINPPITHEKAVELTYLAAMGSEIRFDNLDFTGISRFIYILASNNQRVEMQVDQVIPQRTKERGRKQVIVFLETDSYNGSEQSGSCQLESQLD